MTFKHMLEHMRENINLSSDFNYFFFAKLVIDCCCFFFPQVSDHFRFFLLFP